jgi:hypothetical protein
MSAYISVPAYLIIFVLTYKMTSSLAIIDWVYFPSSVVAIALSQNPHVINPVLDIPVTFMQTYLMVFALVFIFLFLREQAHK